MRLAVAPLHEAQAALAEHRPSHLVTLGSPDGPAADLVHDGPRLKLAFNDIVEPRAGLVAPAVPHVRELLRFARSWDGSRPMLIHCWAGVSRSPAAAYVVACARTPPGAEGRLAAALRRAAPFATPNRLLVRIADELLGRGGAMTEAVARIGRGADVGLGSRFTLQTTDCID